MVYLHQSREISQRMWVSGFREITCILADRSAKAWLGNQWSDNSVPKIENTIILANFGLLYYFSPCEPVSPYAGFGAAGVYYK